VPPSVTYVSVGEAMSRLDQPGVIFLDARLPDEFVRSHVSGAVNLPVERFKGDYGRLKARLRSAAALVCYCENISCDEGARLSTRLTEAGCDNILFMFEGWEAWEEAGYPVSAGREAGR